MSSIDRRGLSVDPTNGIKAPCRVATTGNITLNGLQTIDDIPLAEGDRVLVWEQTDARQNGPYNASSGNWTRTLDADSNDEWVNGYLLQVIVGTTLGGLLFRCDTDDPIVLDESEIAFASVISPGLPGSGVSISQYGAIPFDDSAPAVAANVAAFAKAFAASPIVFVPPGFSFYCDAIVVPATARKVYGGGEIIAAGSLAPINHVFFVSFNTAGFTIEDVKVTVDRVAFPNVNGITLANCAGATVYNCDVQGAFAVYVLASTKIDIVNNKFQSEYGRAIHVPSTAAAIVTIDNGAAAFVHWAGHGLVAGMPVILYGGGTAPAGLVFGKTYIVAASGFATNQFRLQDLITGTIINTSSAGSGTFWATGNGSDDVLIAGNVFNISAITNAQCIVTKGLSGGRIVYNNIKGAAHFGISVSLGARVVIGHNRVASTVTEGIHTDSGVDIAIDGNQLTYDATSVDVGISVSSDNGPPAVNFSVTGNNIDSPSGTGIYIVGAQYGGVSGNTIRNANVSNTVLSASIILDGTAAGTNFVTVGTNTIWDTLGNNAYQVGEGNYTGGGTPNNNLIAPQLGTKGTAGYILTAGAATKTVVRAKSSPSGADTSHGFAFDDTRFATRDASGLSVDLSDYTGTIVMSLGNGSTDTDLRLGQGSFSIYDRGFSTLRASFDGSGMLVPAIAAPATPAASKSRGYVDSTTKAWVNKDDAGVVHTTVVPDTGASNNFLTGITAAGVPTKAQPSAANLSNGTTGTAGSAVVLQTAPTITTPALNGTATGTGVATANTANTLVQRDGSGNFSAGTITAALTGNASTATTATNTTNSAITNDTTTNATMFPTWVTANTGNLPLKVSSTKVTFNPSTGVFTIPQLTTTANMSVGGVITFNTQANVTSGPGFSWSTGNTFLLAGGTAGYQFNNQAGNAALLTLSDTGVIALAAQLGLKAYTVGTLPSGTTGQIVYATNVRVFNGAGVQEGAGAGTGGSVEYNGSAWKIAGTNITAVA